MRLHVVDRACDRTDDEAEAYDRGMIDTGKYNGGGNVVISRKTLLRMKTDASFRAKVYASIEGFRETGSVSGGPVKSTGAVIHEDGTAGYWTEFNWGDEESAERFEPVRDKEAGGRPVWEQGRAGDPVSESEMSFLMRTALLKCKKENGKEAGAVGYEV